MNNMSLKILRELESEGEITLCNLAQILQKKHHDHRDFYPLASLIIQGFIEDSMLKKESIDMNPDYKKLKIQLLAWKLFATSTADKKAEYKGYTWSIGGSGEKLKDQLYSLTGAGYLYLNEARIKEIDKRFTFLIAIFSAILASSLTYYLGKL